MPYSPITTDLPEDPQGRHFVGPIGKVPTGRVDPSDSNQATAFVEPVAADKSVLFPTAAAPSDVASGPVTTVIQVLLKLWNGTNWIRARGDATNGLSVDITRAVDGSIVTLGNKTDDKSTATNTTSVSAMSVWKQISASVQNIQVFVGAWFTARTYLHTTATVTTGSTEIINAEATRSYLLIQNASSIDVFIKVGAAAVVNEGIKLAPGASYEISPEHNNHSVAAVNGIVASGSALMLATECI